MAQHHRRAYRGVVTLNPIPITLIGGPTVLFEFAGLTLLTDPTFDPPGEYTTGLRSRHKLRGPSIAATDLPAIDAVLLTHDTHLDNLDHAGRELLGTVPLTFSTPAAQANIESVRGLAPWQHVTLTSRSGEEVRLTAVPALHGPREVEHILGDVTGFVLEAERWPSTYVSGDNASIDLVAEIAERFPLIRIAIIFMGAARVPAVSSEILTLDAVGAVEAARLLTRATIVPVHAEGWSHYSEPREAIAPTFSSAGLEQRLELLPVGELVTIAR